MLRYATLAILALFISNGSFATDFQKIDKSASKIPSNNTKTVELLSTYIKNQAENEDEMLRASYVWICKNISPAKDSDEDFLEQNASDSLANVILKKKKASYNGYAELFMKICLHLNIECYTVWGYLKTDNGIAQGIRTWNAVRTSNGKWFLFDALSGYGNEINGKFIKKFTTDYFMVLPDSFIKTHMPFEPMWQLIDHPITTESFLQNNAASTKSYFNYNDSISVYNPLFRSEQLQKLSRSIKTEEVNEPLRLQMLARCNKLIPVLKQKEKFAVEYRSILMFNEAATNTNKAIDFYNKFLALKKSPKSKQNQPKIKAYLDSCTTNINLAEKNISPLIFEKEDQISQRNKLAQTLSDLKKQVGEEITYLKPQKKVIKKKAHR